MDSSVVDLCLSLFPWATFRSRKGGIKLYTLLDHDGHIPAFLRVTDANVSDIKVARTLKLPASSIVVMDRGYIDFNWFAALHQRGIFFVTRMKRGMRYKVAERRAVLVKKGLTSDQTVVLSAKTTPKELPPLRRVGFRDPETGHHYAFLTNISHLSARTIADIYKERWQIESFFKWVKQNLKIKTFLGTSKNAVMTQIWIAVITLLLLKYYKFRSKLNYRLSHILKLLQLNIFDTRNIWQLFDPGPTKQMLPGCEQLSLNFNNF
jgi:putative transposase